MKTEAAATTLRRDTAPPPRPAGCGGDGCNAGDPWPLHHVRHRTVFCRLCTSCVLKYQAGSFCVVCFDLFDALPSPPAAPPVLVCCSRCPSVAHSACLADAERASTYLCPSCSNPEGFSYFRVSKDGQQRSFDLASAKVLLAATRLAAASMSRAAVAARAEKERKVREAAVARKRAREMLERVFTLSKMEMEKEKNKEANGAGVVPLPAMVEPKKKMPKLSSTVAAMVGQKRVQNRDTDRWMKFQEPMVIVPKPVQGVVDDKSKVASLTGMQNHTNNGEMKDKLRSLPCAGNDVGQMESKERGVLSCTQSPFVKEEDGVVGRC